MIGSVKIFKKFYMYVPVIETIYEQFFVACVCRFFSRHVFGSIVSLEDYF